MNSIVDASLKTLDKSQELLECISDDILSNTSIPPYYSSIGSHLRHIYDFYYCALTPNHDGVIDLTSRCRDVKVETCSKTALQYLNIIKQKIQAIKAKNTESFTVIDDLGTGKLKLNYTLDALLAQANSHTIHHYAIINYLLDRLGVSLTDSNFGYNPTTPKAKREIENI